MPSAINVGSINLPKMMRHISHRTSQVRELVFVRDPVYRKETKTTGTTTGTEGNTNSDKALAGPAVNFGYETSSFAQQDAGVDLAYHVYTPEIVLPGLTMLQSPIASRSGALERSGHRITGACTFYAPSLDYIRELDNFKDTKAFSELESYDKLIDIERIIQNPADITSTGNQTIDLSPDSTYPAGYELDRIQFKVKTGDNIASITLNGVDDTSKAVVWTATDVFNPADWTTVDLPVRDIEANDTKEIYITGVGKTFTASTVTLDVDKLIGGVSTSYLSSLVIATGGNTLVELRDIYLYKEAEWRIESIKDYRDEYMQIAAVRVRGERASRRRAYG